MRIGTREAKLNAQYFLFRKPILFKAEFNLGSEAATELLFFRNVRLNHIKSGSPHDAKKRPPMYRFSNCCFVSSSVHVLNTLDPRKAHAMWTEL